MCMHECSRSDESMGGGGGWSQLILVTPSVMIVAVLFPQVAKATVIGHLVS